MRCRIRIWRFGRGRFLLRISMVILASFVHDGCFRYVPTEVGEVPPGANVRVYFTVEEKRRLEDEDALEGIDMGTPPALTGTLAKENGDRFFCLRVAVGARQTGFHSEELDQIVPISTTGVVEFERRKFDWLSTGALAAGAAVLIGTVAYTILSSSRQPINHTFPEPNNIRIPISWSPR